MRKFCAIALAMFFAWNLVLGGTNSLVLCFHTEGDVHIELFGKEVSRDSSDCTGANPVLENSECPPCTDLVWRSADSGPARTSEVLGSFGFSPLLLSGSPETLTEKARRVRSQIDGANPTTGPPHGETALELISRTIVLRL